MMINTGKKLESIHEDMDFREEMSAMELLDKCSSLLKEAIGKLRSAK